MVMCPGQTCHWVLQLYRSFLTTVNVSKFLVHFGVQSSRMLHALHLDRCRTLSLRNYPNTALDEQVLTPHFIVEAADLKNNS